MRRLGSPNVPEARPFVPMPWADEALCREVDPELFHSKSQGDQMNEGKAICRLCPVRLECLRHGVANGEWVGGSLWGGFSGKVLHRIKPGTEEDWIALEDEQMKARADQRRATLRRTQEKRKAREAGAA